jgi:hypothetical protein
MTGEEKGTPQKNKGQTVVKPCYDEPPTLLDLFPESPHRPLVDTESSANNFNY